MQSKKRVQFDITALFHYQIIDILIILLHVILDIL